MPLGEREMEGERKWKGGRRKTGERGGNKSVMMGLLQVKAVL